MNLIDKLNQEELNRQKNTLNLIASENYPSPKTLECLSSVFSNKYGEGYPYKRYYAGNQNTDILEDEVAKLALRVFKASDNYGVNLQVLSGSPANSIVFLSVLEYGDTILSLKLASGGHLSHLHSTSNWNKFFKLVNYDLKETENKTFEIDYEDYCQKIINHKPKLVIIGFSSYPRSYEFNKMIEFAHKNNCLVLADIAHINGLVAVGLHPSPFLGKDIETADFVSMTTHKTFRGPRGAMLFAKNSIPDYLDINNRVIFGNKKSLIQAINQTVFPGTSGGPHFNVIASIGQACLEILGENDYPDKISFRDYSLNVLNNTKALENGLLDGQLNIISPSQNHLCLVELPQELDSLDIQKKLETYGIITNRNLLPKDNKNAYRPSGLRLGTSALTSRGLNTDQSYKLGILIARIIFDKDNEKEIKIKVKNILDNLNWYY